MAAIQERNGSYRVLFRRHGKQHAFKLGRVGEAEAKAKADQVDYLLMRLDQGLLTLPPGVDIVEFVRHDGTIPVTNGEPVVARNAPTLASLRDRYLETHGNGSLEHHTLRGINRHFKHLVRLLGDGFPIRELSLGDLQGYVDKRAKAKGRRGLLNPVTIKKEIVTLRTAWNWGVRMKIVAGRYPYDGLRYPKSDEKPPFMTRTEIERQLPGLTEEKAGELYESLYLTRVEIASLLAYIRDHAAHPWIHPMAATACHTGARKGEMLRMKIGDVDFAAGVVIVREKKRAHDRRTTRRIPLSTELAEILKQWLEVHPGGSLLFAHAEHVEHSKKRSLTTGHQSKGRLGSKAARQATVSEREKPGLLPLTEDECHWHFKQTLKVSEWGVIRGLHVCRHSFISACAAEGIDQRFIDEWAGHSTEEQRRRYRHLVPSLQNDKLKSVFG
ncbi:Site-specific recombinase XerD [Singulisphaera sp. GP187]|uniref:site-specific integrase n=1 Tax=Singulisphaera sp. GP187 TaxID=1882752 RepID=UPI00092A284B|nr:tyrosine-type recombinase/integrase [Singulisphaera sp. GP187]SIO11507.1 Site-specific recombinase XerD [Singulisphaera sp. GP187]